MSTTVILLLIAAYFVPTIVASMRRTKGHNGVLVVNLFFGWTFVGWVIALAWAVSGEKRA